MNQDIFSNLVTGMNTLWHNMGEHYRGIEGPLTNSVRDSKRGEVCALLRAYYENLEETRI